LPDASPVIVAALVCPLCIVPLDHLNVHGLYVPTGVAVAVPVDVPEQVDVLVIVGGQQEPIASAVEGWSLAHPKLLHAPDSPSPLVANVTSRLLPGEQAEFAVMVTQNSHTQVWPASVLQLSPKLFPGPPTSRLGSSLS